MRIYGDILCRGVSDKAYEDSVGWLWCQLIEVKSDASPGPKATAMGSAEVVAAVSWWVYKYFDS